MNTLWDTRPYWQRCLDSLSQCLNVLLLNGMPDESISGRAWRGSLSGNRRWKAVAQAAEVLFWFRDRGHHCRAAFEQDLERAARRAEYLANLKLK